MTLRLELPPSVESGLLSQARACGLSLEEYASKILQERSSEAAVESTPKKKSLVELFAALRGIEIDFSRTPSVSRPVDL